MSKAPTKVVPMSNEPTNHEIGGIHFEVHHCFAAEGKNVSETLAEVAERRISAILAPTMPAEVQYKYRH